MHRFCILLALSILSLSRLSAQYFYGEVKDQQQVVLPDAVVVWTGTSIGATTSETGEFVLPLPSDTTHLPLRLAVIYGDAQDTFLIDDLHVYWSLEMTASVGLKEVVIKDAVSGAYISVLQPVKTEIINRAELRKAACCDLAGCFETQSTVQPTTTNILTNAKELRILGLSGVYNQVLLDGLPTVIGLTYTYGTGSIPGSMLENIWVVKGANSVAQGFEGMVGQITVYPREGGIAEPVTADVLLNSFGEQHYNAATAVKKNKWSNYLALHYSHPGGKWDRDNDQLLDLPLLTRYGIYNKWRYRKENEKGWSSFVAARWVKEERIGGQTFFHPDADAGTSSAYGQILRYQQPELLTKTGYRFDPNHKITLLASVSAQQQDSWFGLTSYRAQQQYAYANLQYEWYWGPKKLHELKAGSSYRRLHLNEDIAFAPADTLGRTYDGNYRTNDAIPGFFAENTLHLDGDRWVLITGLRADHHQRYGWLAVPRALLRFTPSADMDWRLSAGRGWRNVYLFPENTALLAGNRDIQFTEALDPERSWNVGINMIRRRTIRQIQCTATADVYRTWFQNQFFPDYDTSPTLALISNFRETSVSNGIQVELSAQWTKRVELKTAWNYLDVFRRYDGQKKVLPFNPRHRVLGVLTLRSANLRWQLDLNMHWYGEQRLPDTRLNPEPLRRPDYAPAYTIASSQLKYTFPKEQVELFIGCENIMDFRQLRPVPGWEQPFARGFDPAFAWGPVRGREWYVGCHYQLQKPKS